MWGRVKVGRCEDEGRGGCWYGVMVGGENGCREGVVRG